MFHSLMVRGGRVMKRSTIVKRRPAKKRATTMRMPAFIGAPQRSILEKGVAQEIKVVDTAANNTVSAGGNLTHLTSISSGADLYQRIGRAVALTGVQVRVYFNLTGANLFNDFVRVSVVYDREPNNAVPPISDIFSNISNVGALTSSADCFTNPAFWDRFTILAEQTFFLIPDNNGVVPPSQPSFNQDPNSQIYFNKYIPLNKLACRFLDGAAGVPTTGALYLIVQGLLAGGAIGQNWVAKCRVTYVDP